MNNSLRIFVKSRGTRLDYDSIFLVYLPLIAVLLFLTFPTNFSAGISSIIFMKLSLGHVVIGHLRVALIQNVKKQFGIKVLSVSIIFIAMTTASDEFFWFSFLIGLVWTHYHYMRQHYGVARLLTVKNLLGNYRENQLDQIFFATAYFAPIFYFVPSYVFNPSTINGALLSGGMHRSIWWVMSLFEWAIKITSVLWWPMIAFWLCYLARIFLQYRTDRLQLKKFLFALFLLGSTLFSFYFLPASLAVMASVVIHSLQYYYLVSKDQIKNNPAKGVAFAIMIPVLIGLSFGFFFGYFDQDAFLQNRSPAMRFLCGLGIALGLIHFWMDSFIWKRKNLESAQL